MARPNERLYTILVKGKASNISTERLKPAFVPAEEASEPSEAEDESRNEPTNQQPPPPALRTYSRIKERPRVIKKVTFADDLGGSVVASR